MQNFSDLSEFAEPKRRIEHEDKETNASMLRCPPEEEEDEELDSTFGDQM